MLRGGRGSGAGGGHDGTTEFLPGFSTATVVPLRLCSSPAAPPIPTAPHAPAAPVPPPPAVAAAASTSEAADATFFDPPAATSTTATPNVIGATNPNASKCHVHHGESRCNARDKLRASPLPSLSFCFAVVSVRHLIPARSPLYKYASEFCHYLQKTKQCIELTPSMFSLLHRSPPPWAIPLSLLVLLTHDKKTTAQK